MWRKFAWFTEKKCCSPPTIEEVHESGTGQGVLTKVNPRGIASNSWAVVEFREIQVSVRAMTSMLWVSAKSAIVVYWRGLLKDLMLRVHILKEETRETGPGLNWISPEIRIRSNIKLLQVWDMQVRWDVRKNESGMVLKELNAIRWKS